MFYILTLNLQFYNDILVPIGCKSPFLTKKYSVFKYGIVYNSSFLLRFVVWLPSLWSMQKGILVCLCWGGFISRIVGF